VQRADSCGGTSRPLEALTARGLRTRTALVTAARGVFAERGYANARITDVSRAAGMAHGSFYTYFSTKEAVLMAVVEDLQREMATQRDIEEPPLQPLAGIEAGHRRYLQAYRANADLMAVLEQVGTLSPELRALRRENRRFFVERTARAIGRWQDAGLADPALDAFYTANALGSMVDRFAYVWFVLGEDFDEERAIATLTRLWGQALGLDHADVRKSRRLSALGRRRSAGPTQN